jgi:hypothetical protein
MADTQLENDSAYFIRKNLNLLKIDSDLSMWVGGRGEGGGAEGAWGGGGK